MRPLVTGMRNNQGFTLVEILVVLVIISITIGFAVLAFGDFGKSRRLLFSAEQFINTLQLAQQKAILESKTLGVRIDQNGYQILKYQTKWEPVSNKGLFRMTYFPKDSFIGLKTTNSIQTGLPSIILNASGDMTPFSLQLGTSSDQIIATIIGSQNGSLQLNRDAK